MMKNIATYYKIPILISLTVFLALIGLNITRDPIIIVQLILGAMLGAFILDLEFVIYAYFLEPEKEFSKTLLGYFRDRDFGNFISFLNSHKDEVEDKTLNSSLFQFLLVLLCFYVVYSNAFIFAKSLLITTFAVSIYKYAESYFGGKLDDWFWVLKVKPSQAGSILYGLLMSILFIFCVMAFRY